ncbi:hypothetical protein HaLaN_11233 [Haematococcus lacustris]|uniref:Uncharacterized protein n=1 Tax=Haematococcus lacustris TaxID=44745 RepID=A0A699ZHG0_HAELA|nr:hypothetical protein HaLaN_11233 [Haematococcus lacustris]
MFRLLLRVAESGQPLVKPFTRSFMVGQVLVGR